MEIYFATGNEHKLLEAREILTGFEIKHFPFNYNEIRSDSLEEIAKDSVESAFSLVGKPVFVEDSGLFIDSLHGFPGTYSGWVYRKIGSGGILRLLEGSSSRSAKFASAIAYFNGDETKVFMGECRGSISEKKQGESGFGYDPVFIPEGESKTFAQSIILKNKLSHRYNSLLEFSNYLRKTH